MTRTATATAAKLKYIPLDAIYKHRSRIQAKLADAYEALSIADDKLGEALDAYEENSMIDWADMTEARLNARLFAGLLEGVNGGTALPNRVFRAIANYENKQTRNPAHIEGAILALRLAELSLESALGMADQLDGAEIDEAYHVPFAALGTIRSYGSFLRSEALGFDQEAVLETILAKPRTLALAA